ncbi:MAG: TetR/AcrR family transcriptional regulator [Acidobacteriaceae bacterium]|nr:TetR/AcrR family transcriptional regulator [Acidobacteriaceae bacterium]
MIPNTRTQKKQSEILNAATELFLERGYDAVSLDDILARVGGSKTTLYSYYGDKEGLFAAMVERTCQTKLAPLLALNLTDLAPAEGLSVIGHQFVSLVSNPEGRGVFRVMIAEAPRFPDLAAAFFARGPEAVIRTLRHHIEQWQKKGYLRCGNAEMMAVQFLGLMTGNFHLKNLLGLGERLSERQMKTWVGRGVEIFLEGVSLREQ